MRKVGRRVAAQVDVPRYLDFWWSGIGTWRA
ncbi:Uncharacterised protein [Nocardia otitidiscaviarum]|nr:Uncharacterised protein [Nocardia otitidiscaviarum]